MFGIKQSHDNIKLCLLECAVSWLSERAVDLQKFRLKTRKLF